MDRARYVLQNGEIKDQMDGIPFPKDKTAKFYPVLDLMAGPAQVCQLRAADREGMPTVSSSSASWCLVLYGLWIVFRLFSYVFVAFLCSLQSTRRAFQNVL